MNSYSTDNTDIDDAGLLEYAASLGYGTSPATQLPMSNSINLGPQDVSGDSNEVHSDEHSAVRISVMNDYINNTMQKEIAEFARNGNLKSGYANLDAITNLYPGLYFIGAISSLGKTTFIHQMADQMAANGQHVLFFSLEQSTLELASKSLARIQAHKNRIIAMTSLQIRKHGTDPRVAEAVSEYSKFAENVTIVECSFRASIEDIAACINDYTAKHEQKPVVMIDYLQVIQAPKDSRLTTKDLIDSYVRRLKQLQEDNKLTMIVVSSLNRQNYMSLVDFESFKETGGIEYTADVVWGLQLQVLHDELFNEQHKLNEKRTAIRSAKAATPRKVELVCLKNRFGISSYECRFDYYPANDYFIPDMTDIDVNAAAAADKDPDGFQQLPPGIETPFD